MVECGIEYKKLLSGLVANGISLSDIKACVITHEHKDHCKSLNDLLNVGIPCYAPQSLNYNNSDYFYTIGPDSRYKVCDWLKLIAFPVAHDVEAYGYVFYDTESKESILFINDTKCFDFPLKEYSFNYIFIECNHIRQQLEVVMQRAMDNGQDYYKYKRQCASHMSLAGCKLFLSKLNLKSTKGIFLMHLSSEISNDIIIKTEISNTFNIPTYVCYKKGGIN